MPEPKVRQIPPGVTGAQLEAARRGLPPLAAAPAAKKKRAKQTCSICHELGHNAMTCKSARRGEAAGAAKPSAPAITGPAPLAPQPELVGPFELTFRVRILASIELT